MTKVLVWVIESRMRPKNLPANQENDWAVQGVYAMTPIRIPPEIARDLEMRPYVFMDRKRAMTIAATLNKSLYAEYRVRRASVVVKVLKP